MLAAVGQLVQPPLATTVPRLGQAAPDIDHSNIFSLFHLTNSNNDFFSNNPFSSVSHLAGIVDNTIAIRLPLLDLDTALYTYEIPHDSVSVQKIIPD